MSSDAIQFHSHQLKSMQVVHFSNLCRCLSRVIAVTNIISIKYVTCINCFTVMTVASPDEINIQLINVPAQVGLSGDSGRELLITHVTRPVIL